MPKLTFIGTRGEIEIKTALHQMHTSLLISSGRKRVMIDCGLDWLGKIEDVAPDAIVLTHAHMDHAWGLQKGAPCPVYATDRTWSTLERCDIQGRVTLPLRTPADILGTRFEAFPIEHSLRCPAVGYRVEVGKFTFFYSPDVVYIPERNEALGGINVYIGDGASIVTPMVRRKGNAIFGHAPIRTQLAWCQKEHVVKAIFTHCGSEIVSADADSINDKIASLARDRGIQAQVAYDGMEVKI